MFGEPENLIYLRKSGLSKTRADRPVSKKFLLIPL